MDDKQSPRTENDDEEDPSRQPGFFARIIKFAGGDSASDEEDIPDIGATPVERALVQNIITMRGQRVEEVMIPPCGHFSRRRLRQSGRADRGV